MSQGDEITSTGSNSPKQKLLRSISSSVTTKSVGTSWQRGSTPPLSAICANHAASTRMVSASARLSADPLYLVSSHLEGWASCATMRRRFFSQYTCPIPPSIRSRAALGVGVGARLGPGIRIRARRHYATCARSSSQPHHPLCVAASEPTPPPNSPFRWPTSTPALSPFFSPARSVLSAHCPPRGPHASRAPSLPRARRSSLPTYRRRPVPAAADQRRARRAARALAARRPHGCFSWVVF